MYCGNFESTRKEDVTLPGYEEHIYDTINCYDDKNDEQGVGSKSVAPSTGYQHRLQNPYDDDRVSIKSDDVSCDQAGGYSVPDVKVNREHSSKPKPLPKPRYANKPDINAQLPTSKKPSTDNEYLLQAATQRVNSDEYILHDATQRVNNTDFSLDTTHTVEAEEYTTQAGTQIETGEYASIDVTHHTTDNDYQEIVLQSPSPPGYAVPSNIPATS